LTSLATFEAPRSDLGRSNKTSYFHQKISNSTPLPRKPTFAELVEEGVVPSPWSKDHPKCLRNKYSSWPEDCLAFERQKHFERVERRRQEQRRVTRQLDGSRSLAPSPTISRINTINTINPLKRADTDSSGASGRSTQSSNSSRISSFLSRVQSLPFTAEDDRKPQGHEAPRSAQQQQHIRRSGTGTDSESDTAPHGSLGQRGLFGKHKSKSALQRPSHLRSESSSRRDKLCPDFLKKNWSRHRRAQSDD
jgi:hypothetical protein